MLKTSKAHLAQVGESYFEHMQFALLVAIMAIGAGYACLIHAIVPALCPHSCSRTLGLLQRLFADRSQLRSVANEASSVILFVTLSALSTLTAIVVAYWTAGTLVGLVVIPEAFALPLIFLSQNPDLVPNA